MGNESGQYNWHIAGFLGWPFAVLKYKYIFFQIKHTEAIHQTALGNWYDLKSSKC